MRQNECVRSKYNQITVEGKFNFQTGMGEMGFGYGSLACFLRMLKVNLVQLKTRQKYCQYIWCNG